MVSSTSLSQNISKSAAYTMPHVHLFWKILNSWCCVLCKKELDAKQNILFWTLIYNIYIDFPHPYTSRSSLRILTIVLPGVYTILFPFHKLQQLLNLFGFVMNTATLKYTYKDFYFEAAGRASVESSFVLESPGAISYIGPCPCERPGSPLTYGARPMWCSLFLTTEITLTPFILLYT